MASKKKCSKKCRATLPHRESLGIRPGRMYRATLAWLRHLAAVLRRAFARAGAAVASNVAALIMKQNLAGHGVPPTRERVEGSDVISVSAPAYEASDSAPSLPPSPATPPPPTGAKNCASTPPLPTGAKNCGAGSQATGSTSTPAYKASDSAPLLPPSPATPPLPTGAKNCGAGSQATGSASTPASNSRYSDPRPAPKPATSSPPTGANNSGSQSGGSAPVPASKVCDSAPRLTPKSATPPTATGAKNSNPAAGASITPSAGTEADGFAQNRGLNISYRQTNLFSDGYHLNSLFEEEESFVVDEEVLNYARFCSERATSLLINKKEICHICFFDHDRVFPCKKDELKDHCKSFHHTSGFLCEKQGCLIRASSKGESGRHHLFCHEKHRDWWVQYLKQHGGM